jgi:hypothetical protein
MRALLDSVKADLLDRRLRVVVVIVAVGVVGALGFAALSGGGQSETQTASAGPVGTGGAKIPPVGQASTSANSAKHAAAETTYGTAYQHANRVGDPFVQLATTTTTTSTKSASAATATVSKSAPTSTAGSGSSSAGSSSHSSSGSSSPSSSSSGHTTPPPQPKPQPHAAQPHAEYRVKVELGPAPASPGEAPQLIRYDNVKLGKQLPSKSHPLVVLEAANVNATSPTKATATFGLISSPIVNGPGVCVPSDTQCESVRLTVGQVQELQYVEANGQTVAYLLRLVSVVKKTSTSG